jgi:hypothetical protein
VPLGDAQIKNLTDRLNALASGGLGKVFYPGLSIVSGPNFGPVSLGFQIPAASANQEWRIEASGNGDWGGTGGVLEIRGQPAGNPVAGNGGNYVQLANTDIAAGNTAPFDWRVVLVVSGRSNVLLVCHMSAVISPHPNANGLSIERADDTVGSIGSSQAFIEMRLTGGGQAACHRCVMSTYGG